MNKTLNLTEQLDVAFSRAMDAVYYASLLARHAYDAVPSLAIEPGKPSFAIDFRTSNPEIPTFAQAQFADEVVRYSLIYSLAHYDRFVLDLAVLDTLVNAIATKGPLPIGDAIEIERRVRTVRKNQSVAQELDRLAGSTSEPVAAGVAWFRGLYAIRNCLVHRAGIVGIQDKRLLAGIVWRRMIFVHNDIELSGELPQVLGEGTIGVRFEDVSRSWRDGERVTLTLDELRQMTQSLFQLAALLVQHLNADFASRLGLTVSAEKHERG